MTIFCSFCNLGSSASFGLEVGGLGVSVCSGMPPKPFSGMPPDPELCFSIISSGGTWLEL